MAKDRKGHRKLEDSGGSLFSAVEAHSLEKNRKNMPSAIMLTSYQPLSSFCTLTIAFPRASPHTASVAYSSSGNQRINPHSSHTRDLQKKKKKKKKQPSQLLNSGYLPDAWPFGVSASTTWAMSATCGRDNRFGLQLPSHCLSTSVPEIHFALSWMLSNQRSCEHPLTLPWILNVRAVVLISFYRLPKGITSRDSCEYSHSISCLLCLEPAADLIPFLLH